MDTGMTQDTAQQPDVENTVPTEEPTATDVATEKTAANAVSEAPVTEPRESTSAEEVPATGPEDPHEEEESMESLLEESLAPRRFHRGEMVEGVIVLKTDKEIVIDIGGKSEGIVPPQDLERLDPEFINSLNVGDTVVAYVLKPEGREGHTVLSLSKARVEYEWRQAQEWQKSGTILEGVVTEANSGGVIVRLGQLRGFIPGSQLERREGTRSDRKEERFASLVGQTLKFKVIEVDKNRRRLILSEKEALKEEREKQRQRLLEELREGEVRHGRVTSLTKFGAFVDLGGVDGLIHISELSWGRVEHPSEVLKVGDEIDVYVLKVDREKGKVNLSLKRLLPKPWETVLERYAIGQVVEGTVTRVLPFGAFVRLDDGIEGLVHISELSQDFVSHPHEVVKEGQRVQARIINIDPDRKRMGLSIKQADEEAYVEIDWDVADEEEAGEGTWEVLEDVTLEESDATATSDTAEVQEAEEETPAEPDTSEESPPGQEGEETNTSS